MSIYAKDPEPLRLVYRSEPYAPGEYTLPVEEAQRGPDAFKAIGKVIVAVASGIAKAIGKLDSSQSGH